MKFLFVLGMLAPFFISVSAGAQDSAPTERSLDDTTTIDRKQLPLLSLGSLIPTDRITTWQPGVTYNGGIPNRATIHKTISPRGDNLDDTATIQAALDSCPRDQIVQLTTGTFNIAGALNFKTSDCTLRGAGPGAFADGTGGTRLVKTNTGIGAVIYINQYTADKFSISINLAADAVKGSNSIILARTPGVRVGEIVVIDENTDNVPEVYWGPVHNPPGGASRSWFSRQDRSLAQTMEVTAVNGNTLTFSTPFHYTFKTIYQAQLSRHAYPALRRVGIENLFVTGGRTGHGNIGMSLCAYCWIKNVNSYWSEGASMSLVGTLRSEIRDSYMHETPNPNPGGAGYMLSVDYAASDNLIENNIMWNGNKVIVMRASGGGNVVAYNYMDDAWIGYYPHSPEAGLNAGHYTTPHMELLEGNYSFNYKGDSYWGNSIDITVIRNWLSAMRAAHPPLNNYSATYPDGCVYRYGDYINRFAVDVLAYSYNTNFVGNVLGMPNQQLLAGYNTKCFGSVQTGWAYENFSSFPTNNMVIMWNMGGDQSHTAIGNWGWVADTYQTQLRNGNWDWVTKTQKWHGIGAADGSVASQSIPNSLYLNSEPSFFGNNPWPWVDPSTGATYTLPAKYCFEHNQMPTCLQGNTTPVPTSTPTPAPATLPTAGAMGR
jgi:hypothetical protein